MSEFADLLKGVASAMWVVLALVVFLTLRGALTSRVPFLTKLGMGPTGISMEFAEQKLNEAAGLADQETKLAIGPVAKQAVLRRLERNVDLLRRARILWVDDHPENNTPIVELLTKFGASVETSRANDDALARLAANRYDVIISDVGRDAEGADPGLKGVALAEAVFTQQGQRVLLFSARFDPTRVPGASDAERLALAQQVARTTFGWTNRYDEALHLILDVLERQLL